MRDLGVDVSAVRDKVDRLEHEWELVARQLDGYERPIAPYLNIGIVEWVEPARDRYREQLLEEQERLSETIEFWSMAMRHLTG